MDREIKPDFEKFKIDPSKFKIDPIGELVPVKLQFAAIKSQNLLEKAKIDNSSPITMEAIKYSPDQSVEKPKFKCKCENCGNDMSDVALWSISITIYTNAISIYGGHSGHEYKFDCEKCFAIGRETLANKISKNMKNYPVGGLVILKSPTTKEQQMSLIEFALSRPIISRNIKNAIISVLILLFWLFVIWGIISGQKDWNLTHLWFWINRQ